MAEARKTFGQSAPAANTPTRLCLLSGEQGQTATLQVCNRDSNPGHFRVWVAVAGAAFDVKQVYYWDEAIRPTCGFPITIGICLADGDEVWVQSDNGLISFNLSGVGITP